jgi:hypothetical protein
MSTAPSPLSLSPGVPATTLVAKQHDTLWERIVVHYIVWLQRWRWLVALFCVGLLAGSAVLAPKLLDKTTNAYNPPKNTEAYKADVILGQYFPRLAQTCSLGILVELTNESQVRVVAATSPARRVPCAILANNLWVALPTVSARSAPAVVVSSGASQRMCPQRCC